MAKPAKPLDPPDMARCQAEFREGSFMTLGPRPFVRCEAKPVYLIKEAKPGHDGRQGAMSVCESCYAVALDLYGAEGLIVERL